MGRERFPKFRVYDGRADSKAGCQERFVVYEVDPFTSGVVPLWSSPSLEELELRVAAEGTGEDRFEREIWCRNGEGLMGLGTWGPSGRFLPFGREVRR